MKNKITAQRLMQILNQTGISQRELAERAEIKESSVSHYVNGFHAPSNVNAQKMANVLNVNPLWLMGFDVEMNVQLKTDAAEEITKIANRLNDDGLEKLLAYAEDLCLVPKYLI